MKQRSRKIYWICAVAGLILIFLTVILISKKNDSRKDINTDTVPDIADSFSFTSAGDYGATKNTEKVLELIGKIKPAFNLAVGDLSYSQLSPESKWCDFVKSRVGATPFLLLSGNHESDKDERDGDIHKFADCLPFNLNTKLTGVYSEEYFFDYPKNKPTARFILTTPDLEFKDGRAYDYSSNGKAFEHVRNLIRDAKQKNIQWIIVSMHKVCISTEHKDCEIGEDFPNMLISEGVNLVLAGHVHAYERTYPLVCMRAEKSGDDCLGSGDRSAYNEKDGTIFVTVGTGGIDLRSLDSKDKEATYFASRHGKDEGHFGIFKAIVKDDRLEGRFLDASTSETVDAFSINR